MLTKIDKIYRKYSFFGCFHCIIDAYSYLMTLYYKENILVNFIFVNATICDVNAFLLLNRQHKLIMTRIN